jgi:hypothetical protein
VSKCELLILGQEQRSISAQCVSRFTSSAILSSVYGWPALELGSPEVVHLLSHAARLARAALPGNFLVDIIPLMKYLPTWIAPWKRDGLEWYIRDTEMYENFVSYATGGTVSLGFLKLFDSLSSILIEEVAFGSTSA